MYNIEIDDAYSCYERSLSVMKNKHLSSSDRLEIEKGLNDNLSFKKIGEKLEKDCTTISKEVKNHIIYKNTGAIGRQFFDKINLKQTQRKKVLSYVTRTLYTKFIKYRRQKQKIFIKLKISME